ncbi:MAG: GH3 auxin-responsive promoter family protein [Dehalococcoidia bacterium]
MTRPVELMREGKKEELWKMCCGFLNLNLEEFMIIQKRLLLEQIQLLKGCEMGRRLMRGAMPETVQEFRNQVPLTTYDDYLPELTDRHEDWLPTKPAVWVHTVGRAGEYNFKWVPFPQKFMDDFEKVAGGIGLLGSCNHRGDFPLKEHMQALPTISSPYYGSGVVGYLMQQALGIDFLPSDSDMGGRTFDERMKAALEEALTKGLDAVGGLPSILVYIGEMFRRGNMSIDRRFLLSHPRAFARVAKAVVRSKLAGRAMLPRDLWSVKAVLGGGVDSAVFRDTVEGLWGRCPLEVYGGTEGGVYAIQTWDYDSLTFVPNLNFFEFIPERELLRWQMDESYRIKTVLLDEVSEGGLYEPVITNFHGGIMTRYRLGDMVRITSLRNHKLNIDIPQMVFHSRVDDLVDVAGLGRLTERTITEAIEKMGIPHVDWVARKEIVDNKPTLHIYVEFEDGYIASEESVAAATLEQFRRLDRRYRCNFYRLIGDMVRVLDLKPIEISILPQGAFASYFAQRQAEGAGANGLGRSHINPSDEVISMLRAPKVVVEAVPVVEEERAVAR